MGFINGYFLHRYNNNPFSELIQSYKPSECIWEEGMSKLKQSFLSTATCFQSWNDQKKLKFWICLIFAHVSVDLFWFSCFFKTSAKDERSAFEFIHWKVWTIKCWSQLINSSADFLIGSKSKHMHYFLSGNLTHKLDFLLLTFIEDTNESQRGVGV